MYQILPHNVMFLVFFLIFNLIFLFSQLNFCFFQNKIINSSKEKMKTKKTKYVFLSLFSSFDPKSSMSIFSFEELNWLIIFILTSLYFFNMWTFPNRLSILKNTILKELKKQFSIALKTQKDGSSVFFLSLFLILFSCNLMGLIPNLFTPTSHITFNLTISISMWLGFFLFGWVKYTNKMFAHLVPLSTPKPLISFMVLIETISNIIRPGTLSIRLMANMISGHLLLTLMGNSMQISSYFNLLIFSLVQTMLFMLEIGVGLIQGYVFCMLLSLYSDDSDFSKETH